MRRAETKGMVEVGLRRAGVTATALVVTGGLAWSATAVSPPAVARMSPVAATSPQLTSFSGCEDLAAWYRPMLRRYITPMGLTVPPGFGGAGRLMRAVPSAESRDQIAASAAKDAVEAGATGTNVQEAGVDEPDVMKSAGGRLVTTVGDRLEVYDVTGSAPVRIGSLRVLGAADDAGSIKRKSLRRNPGEATELLLVGDRVVLVTASDYRVLPTRAHSAPSPSGTAATSTTDSAAATPTPSATESDSTALAPGAAGATQAGDPGGTAPGSGATQPGDPGGSGSGSGAAGPHGSGPASFASSGPAPSSSMIPVPGRRVPTVAIRVVDIAEPARPVLVSEEEVEGTLVAAREVAGSVRVVTSSVPSFGPERLRTSADLDQVGGEELLPHVVVRSHTGEASRVAPALSCRDLTHPDISSGPGIVSVRTVDVAAAKPGAGPVVHTTGVAADGDIVYASRDRLFAATTRGGWGMLAETSGRDDATGVSTQVHAFDIGSLRQTRYLGSGSVTGYVLDRWAMSARDGTLRIATTRQPQPGFWAGRTDSAVSVLQESGSALTLVGEVTGLGKGERITSVRWFDDFALVVTFRQTDPFYVVDLRQPTTPRLRGELKVPGFSTYLHPIGDHRILGVGSAATDQGEVTGAQLSVFDISDPDHPRRESVLIRDQVFTPVGDDARLFRYTPTRRTAVLPVMSTATVGSTLEGFRVARDGQVVPAGVAKLGEIDRLVAIDGNRMAVTAWQASARTLSLVTIDGLVRTGSIPLIE